MAGALGAWATGFLGPQTLRWILGISFIAMTVWMLIPDKLDEGDLDKKPPRFGVFGTTVLVFFLAEMGDKTQIATVMLAARYKRLLLGGCRHHAGHDAGQCAGGLARQPLHAPDSVAGGACRVGAGLCGAGRAGAGRTGLACYTGRAPICSACGRVKSTAKDDPPHEPGLALAMPGFLFAAQRCCFPAPNLY